MRKHIYEEVKTLQKEQRKSSELQTILTVIFVSCYLVTNIITVKPIQLPFGVDYGSAIVFPLTYILSDLFSEVYGYRWSRITCYLAFAANLLMVVVFQIDIALPAASYWTDQDALATILGSAPRVFIASVVAYVFGDFVNDKVFRRMKQKHPNSTKGYGARAIVSSVFGDIADATVFIPLAFFGEISAYDMLIMGVTQVSLKLLYEIIILPLNRFVTGKVLAYEQKLS